MAIEHSPNDVVAYANRGISKYNLKNNNGALADFNKAIMLDPEIPAIYLHRGYARFSANNFLGGTADFNKLVKMEPEQAWSYYHRGTGREATQNYIGAMADYKKGVELDPKNIACYANIGRIEIISGYYMTALGTFTKTIEIDSVYPAGYYYRGICKAALKDSLGALADYKKATELAPEVADGWIRKGTLNRTKFKDYESAIADFTKAIALDSTNQYCYYSRGMMYLEIQKNKEAIGDFSSCIRLNNKNLYAYYYRAQLRTELNECSGAIEDYQYIINYKGKERFNFEEFPAVYNNYACCLMTLGKYEEAMTMVNKALDLDYHLSYIWDTRGELNYHMGHYKDAIKDMDEALSIATDNKYYHNSYYYRGLAKIELGDTKGGLKDLNLAGENGEPKAYEKIKEIMEKI